MNLRRYHNSQYFWTMLLGGILFGWIYTYTFAKVLQYSGPSVLMLLHLPALLLLGRDLWRFRNKGRGEHPDTVKSRVGIAGVVIGMFLGIILYSLNIDLLALPENPSLITLRLLDLALLVNTIPITTELLTALKAPLGDIDNCH